MQVVRLRQWSRTNQHDWIPFTKLIGNWKHQEDVDVSAKQHPLEADSYKTRCERARWRTRERERERERERGGGR